MSTGKEGNTAYLSRCSINVLYAHCDGQPDLAHATEQYSNEAGALEGSKLIPP